MPFTEHSVNDEERAVVSRRSARWFVLSIGIVSAFSDMTHEGARSITGPFMGSLGANAVVVSSVSGVGELLGYTLRSVFGMAADRSGRYWTITFIGYILQMMVVPAIAISPTWKVASIFIISERIGRAIRTPARDAMTAHAAALLGGGWVFGIREALDATGAVIGPLIVTLVSVSSGDHSFYRKSFVVLAIPAVLCLSSLIATWRFYPHPENLDKESVKRKNGLRAYPRKFWIYLLAMSLVAIGYADWPLIALHFSEERLVRPDLLPGLYVGGMAAEAISSLFLGRLFDRLGIVIVIFVTLTTSFYGPLVFLTGSLPATVLGTIVWGFGMAAQESVVKAAITTMVAPDRRASAYGLFDSCFGIAWFIGSLILGALYSHSIHQAAWFTTIIQLVAVPLLFLCQRLPTLPESNDMQPTEATDLLGSDSGSP